MDAVSVRTADVDRARSEVARVFCPHRLAPEEGVRDVQLQLTARKVGGVGVVDLDYGRPVRIQPGPLESFYLVQLPRAGRATVRHSGRSVDSSPAVASVLSPFDATDMHWDGAPHRIFYASRDSVTRELERLLGRPAGDPLRFEVGMDTTTASAGAWSRGVDFLADELAQSGTASLVDHPAVARRFEEALIGKLLLSQRHTYSDALAAPTPGRLVRRACALMRDHHDEALTVGDVAEALGVSVRTLQDAFRREAGTTPMAYLRECRLDAVHRVLREAGPETSVTTVALKHGFAHMGRFACEYRARFGESPSTTLRR